MTSQAASSSAPNMQIPELESHCGSWVCTFDNGKVFETFDRDVAESALRSGLRVETAAQYLGRFNRAVSA